jgi:hypothetical protein
MTGVNSGAGTTSIIENLGSMLAKLGRKTLVIDPSGNSEPVAFVTFGTDLQKRPVNFPDGIVTGSTSRTPNCKNQAGKSATAGQDRSPERLRLRELPEPLRGVRHCADRCRPLLISAETEYLARMADVTVLVSEAGKTQKSDG